MFCQCGNTVGQGSGASLNVNRASSGKILLIGGIAGFLAMAVMAAIFISALLNHGAQMTDRTKWENISKATYSITLPGNMQEADIDPGYANLTHLDSYRNSNAIVCISSMMFTEDQKRFLKRKKIVEMVKEWVPDDGSGITAQEHGEIIYFSYPQEQSGIFFGESNLNVIEAFYVANDGLYNIDIIMPESKYAKYEDSVFAWLDSFRAKN